LSERPTTFAEPTHSASPPPMPAAALLPTQEPEHTATVEHMPHAASAASIYAELAVSPSHAVVHLDGIALTLPFTGQLPRDGRLHELHASAPGYHSLRQLVGFDRDRNLSIILAPLRSEHRVSRRDSKTKRKTATSSDAPASTTAPADPSASATAPADASPEAIVPDSAPPTLAPDARAPHLTLDTRTPYAETIP